MQTKDLNIAVLTQNETFVRPSDPITAERYHRIETLLACRDSATYFKDGKRKIDYILTYNANEENINAYGRKIIVWRKKFLRNLEQAGLELEKDMVVTTKRKVFFVKVHAPFSVLCLYAELLRLKLPFGFSDDKTSHFTETLFNQLHICNFMRQSIPNVPPHKYSCEFKRSKLTKFITFEVPEHLFLDRDRHLIVHEILTTMTYGQRKRSELGIGRLINEQVFTAAYPLHDGPCEIHASQDPRSYNQRQILRHYWASWNRVFKYQPFEHIRDYFGEKLALYFAWLGFYTAWLHPPAIVGACVFIYGIATMNDHLPTKQVCESGNYFQMCPLCERCDTWVLSDYCLYFTAAYVFDNWSTVFYAIFMSVWAVLFLEFWKRTNAQLAYQWDVFNYVGYESPRPEYVTRCTMFSRNPITGEKEPFFPEQKRLPRMVTSMSVLLLMVALVVIFVIALTIYRWVMSEFLGENPNLKSIATLIASVSATTINLIIVIILSYLYEWLAFCFTEWEMHRTQTEFENHYTFKVFIFQFVNYYTSILYIAFFKGKFVGYPGHYMKALGVRTEECSQAGCLIEVVEQIIVFMIAKQLACNAIELVYPKLMKFLHYYEYGRTTRAPNLQTPYEVEFEIEDDPGLFAEYLEMIIQFGFVTFFVAAFPLAPFFALINNYFEIRLDAKKYLLDYRRLVGEKAQDIGCWFLILQAMSQLAVLSNACLIAFTTDFIPRVIYAYEHNTHLENFVNFTLSISPNGTEPKSCWYRDYRDENGNFTHFYWKILVGRLVFILVFEHIVFSISKGVSFCVPDVPQWVQVRIEREGFMAKAVLADVQLLELLQKTKEEEVDTEDAGVMEANQEREDDDFDGDIQETLA